MHQILLIEDDTRLAGMLSEYLGAEDLLFRTLRAAARA